MLLIFDCDGVILDSMQLHSEVESKAYRELGIIVSPQDLSRRFSGVPQNEVSKILESETGRKVPPNFEIQIDQQKEQIFLQRLKAVPEVHNTLNKLKNVPRCIASGTGLTMLKQALSIVNLYDQFAPNIFSSEIVTRGKPFPDLFLYAAEKMGAKADECLIIEDGIAGVQAGYAANMRVFGFVGGSHCDEEQGNRLKSAGAELVFSNMEELPNLI